MKFAILLFSLSLVTALNLHRSKFASARKNIDYREYFPKGANQNDCGNLWAYATANFLGAYFKLHSPLLEEAPKISPDFFVACNRKDFNPFMTEHSIKYGNNGCAIGTATQALKFAKYAINHNFPLPVRNDFDTISKDNKEYMNKVCQEYMDKVSEEKMTVPDYQRVLSKSRIKVGNDITKEELIHILKHNGPVISTVKFKPKLTTGVKNWFSGVNYYKSKDCDMEEKKERVIIAGYGKKMIGKEEKNVFIIRNSRENSCTEAREDAFIFLDADGDHICGLGKYVVYLQKKEDDHSKEK